METLPFAQNQDHPLPPQKKSKNSTQNLQKSAAQQSNMYAKFHLHC